MEEKTYLTLEHEEIEDAIKDYLLDKGYRLKCVNFIKKETSSLVTLPRVLELEKQISRISHAIVEVEKITTQV